MEFNYEEVVSYLSNFTANDVWFEYGDAYSCQTSFSNEDKSKITYNENKLYSKLKAEQCCSFHFQNENKANHQDDFFWMEKGERDNIYARLYLSPNPVHVPRISYELIKKLNMCENLKYSFKIRWSLYRDTLDNIVIYLSNQEQFNIIKNAILELRNEKPHLFENMRTSPIWPNMQPYGAVVPEPLRSLTVKNGELSASSNSYHSILCSIVYIAELTMKYLIQNNNLNIINENQRRNLSQNVISRLMKLYKLDQINLPKDANDENKIMKYNLFGNPFVCKNDYKTIYQPIFLNSAVVIAVYGPDSIEDYRYFLETGKYSNNSQSVLKYKLSFDQFEQLKTKLLYPDNLSANEIIDFLEATASTGSSRS